MSDDGDAILKALGRLVLVPLVLGLALLGTAYETWIALTLWAWFAPWPMPLVFAQAVGLNLAVSLIVRSPLRLADSRDSGERFTDAFTHLVIVPTMVLVAAWVLRWWL